MGAFVWGKDHAAGANGGKGIPLGENTGSNGGRGVVTATARYGNPCGETCFFGGVFCDIARDIGALIDLCEKVQGNLQGIADLLAPLALGNVEELHSRGVGHLGGIFSRQLEADIVLGKENMSAFRKILGLVLLYPKKLGGCKAGQCGVGGDLDQPFSANARFDLAAFLGGSLIAPKNGGANDLVVLIQKHQTVHLPRKSHAHDLAVPCLLSDGGKGDLHRLPPILGILLCPSVVGLGEGIFGGCRCDDAAKSVKENALGTRGANINSNEILLHGRFQIPNRMPLRRFSRYSCLPLWLVVTSPMFRAYASSSSMVALPSTIFLPMPLS